MNDPHAGQGGSYLLDPDTGERTLIERTQPQTPQAPATAPAEPQPTPTEE